MKATDNFKKVIHEYLEKRSKEDELFAASYAKPGKSLDECVNYILNTVQKSGNNGFADDEIFGMAVHYYDEDDIKADRSSNCRVVINHAVELTEEDKAKAKEDALKKYQEDILQGINKKVIKPKKKVEVEQPSLFEL